MTKENILLTGTSGFASVTFLPEIITDNLPTLTDTISTITPALPDIVIPTANATNLTQALIQILIGIVTLFGLLKKKKTT